MEKLTREDLIVLAKVARIELEKINKHFDEAFAKCEVDLLLERIKKD